METAGLIVGAAGLAGLFTACIDCFELVQKGRYFGKEFLLLERRFLNQWIRLRAWGRACRLDQKDDQISTLEDDEVRSHIEDTLAHLFVLLNDGKELRRKYGMKNEDNSLPLATGAATSIFNKVSQRMSAWHYGNKTLQQLVEGLQGEEKVLQSNSRLRRTAAWAVQDRSKFSMLVQDLKELIDDLENLTLHLRISQRQREAIQQEVWSIRDLTDLQAAEEARSGKFDAVSDAAGLRLSILQDGSSSQSVSQGLETDDLGEAGWQDAADPSKHILDVPDTTYYQTLHRILCTEMPTSIYLDPPDYRAHDRSADQWILLESHIAPLQSRSLHLCGNRNLPSLQGFLAENDRLMFVVLKDYKCDHEIEGASVNTPRVQQQAVVLSSDPLCASLQKLHSYLGEYNEILPKFSRNLILQDPFLWYYHSKLSIKGTVGSMSGPDRTNVTRFLDVLERITNESFAKINKQLMNRTISWDCIEYLFAPGSILLKIDEDRMPDQCQAFQQIGFPRVTRKPSQASPSLELDVRHWDFDGSCKEIRSTLSLHRDSYPFFTDVELPLNDLNILPITYIRDYGVEDLRSRRVGLGEVQSPSVVAYNGMTMDNVENIGSGRRFMIDPWTYSRLHKAEPEPSRTSVFSVPYPPKDYMLFLPPVIHGFDLSDNQWKALYVSNIKPIQWAAERFDEYILDKQTKDSLQAMIDEGHTTQQPSRLYRFVTLLHGGPGTGKTSCIESVAEAARKPLFRFGPAVAGLSPPEFEENFKFAKELTRTWNCVFLIDDQDALLLERDRDLVQESWTATFIRLLDGFTGILALTTTQIGRMDEKVLSRCDLVVSCHKLTGLKLEMLWYKNAIDTTRFHCC